MNVATFCANCPRWVSKQSQENLADCELPFVGDTDKVPLGTDVLVKAFSAKGWARLNR